MDEEEYKAKKLLKELTTNPYYNVAFTVASRDILVELAMTNPPDKEKREALYQEYRALDRIKGKLQSFINEVTMIDEGIKEDA